MAQLLGSVLGGIAGTLLRNFNDHPPDTVVELRATEFIRRSVVDREECLTLYGPSADGKYAVILQIPFHSSAHTVYSLYRSCDPKEAKSVFNAFKDKIPVLLECTEEFSSRHKLQSLCLLLREHPDWTMAHVSAHLGLPECFNHEKIKMQVNVPSLDSGQTPLHLSVASEKQKVVQILLDQDARLDVPDAQGNTVYHLAAKSSKEMVQTLVAKSSTLINHRNKDGHTALHIACLADKPDCVKALILAGADVNATGDRACNANTPTTGSAKEVMEMFPKQLNSKDMKHGGTPLHWAMSREVVEALVELGCLIDARDFKGDTALHAMVVRSRLPCVIALLAHGADVNACNENLDTPLHLALKNGNKSMIQSLLVFGAHLNAVNKLGESPRHVCVTSKSSRMAEMLYLLHSVGAKRCEFGRQNCQEGCIHAGKFDGIPPETPVTPRPRHLFDEMLAAATVAAALSRSPRKGAADVVDGHDLSPPRLSKGYRVLCLDGGGIRGLVLIQVLIALEETLGFPLTQAFDWISGTSTGGILALLLATGRTARYCQSVYFRLKNKVFVGMRPYDSDALERFLQKELGEQTTMADIKFPKVAVTGVLADRYPAELHLFRNYESPMEILGMDTESPFQPTLPPEEQLMWRAARASGAAPTYFRALGRFVDGGLISNNPTLDTITEIHEYNSAKKAIGMEHQVRPIRCIVALGTGKPPTVPVNAIDVFTPQSIWDAAKMAFGVSALGKLLIDQATCSDGRVVDRARAWCNMIDVPYFRFNPNLSEDLSLDETKDEILVNMLWETMVYIRSKKKEVMDLITLLS